MFNYLVGSALRIFTTVQEVDDKLILYGFLAGFALNLALAFQMVGIPAVSRYWDSRKVGQGLDIDFSIGLLLEQLSNRTPRSRSGTKAQRNRYGLKYRRDPQAQRANDTSSGLVSPSCANARRPSLQLFIK